MDLLAIQSRAKTQDYCTVAVNLIKSRHITISLLYLHKVLYLNTGDVCVREFTVKEQTNSSCKLLLLADPGISSKVKEPKFEVSLMPAKEEDKGTWLLPRSSFQVPVVDFLAASSR